MNGTGKVCLRILKLEAEELDSLSALFEVLGRMNDGASTGPESLTLRGCTLMKELLVEPDLERGTDL